MEALKLDTRFTYKDYASWTTDDRFELIDGVPYLMSPAPSYRHQIVIGAIYSQLAGYLKGKPCKVIVSPFDVRLNHDKGDDIVVQPDIVVICDKNKLDDKGCKGAPDMIVEVLSPSSARLDTLVKFQKYQNAGVKEYWIVDPNIKTAVVHILKDGEYLTRVYSDTDIIPVHVLSGCEINMQEVFDED